MQGFRFEDTGRVCWDQAACQSAARASVLHQVAMD